MIINSTPLSTKWYPKSYHCDSSITSQLCFLSIFQYLQFRPSFSYQCTNGSDQFLNKQLSNQLHHMFCYDKGVRCPKAGHVNAALRSSLMISFTVSCFLLFQLSLNSSFLPIIIFIIRLGPESHQLKNWRSAPILSNFCHAESVRGSFRFCARSKRTSSDMTRSEDVRLDPAQNLVIQQRQRRRGLKER